LKKDNLGEEKTWIDNYKLRFMTVKHLKTSKQTPKTKNKDLKYDVSMT
jgi:hypothetical protein